MSIEMQNCVREAEQNLSAARREEDRWIREEANKGFWCLVCRAPWYCRATDAMVGDLDQLIRSHATQWEAEREAESFNESEGCAEYYYYVVGPENPDFRG